MDIKNANYEVTAVKPEQYPVSDIPEVALVGRSNVGKSSIINALLDQKIWREWHRHRVRRE